VAGVVAGLTGIALFVVWAIDGNHDGVGMVGYVSRLVVFLVLGGLIGRFARARAELDVRSRLLFDLSPDLMGTLDTHGSVVTVNDAWRVAAGGATDPAMVTPDWGLELPAPGAAVVFEQGIHAVAHGQRTIEWFVRRDPRRPLLYVVGRDVTERSEQAAHVRQLLGSVQDARASERARVASELHDFVLQHLLVALMHLERDQVSTAAASPVSADTFVRQAIGALRRVVDGIQPLDLQYLSCATVLDRAAIAVEEEWGVEIARTIEVVSSVDEERQLLLYRFVGEALRNAAKHAKADAIQLDAVECDGWISISINDDGVGMPDPVSVSDALAPQFGTGFNLLLEHVLATGGSCDIQSVPGSGTSVGVRIPLTAPD